MSINGYREAETVHRIVEHTHIHEIYTCDSHVRDYLSTLNCDYFESLAPWRSISMTGVAETAPSGTVNGTIRLSQYQL